MPVAVEGGPTRAHSGKEVCWQIVVKSPKGIFLC